MLTVERLEEKVRTGKYKYNQMLQIWNWKQCHKRQGVVGVGRERERVANRQGRRCPERETKGQFCSVNDESDLTLNGTIISNYVWKIAATQHPAVKSPSQSLALLLLASVRPHNFNVLSALFLFFLFLLLHVNLARRILSSLWD